MTAQTKKRQKSKQKFRFCPHRLVNKTIRTYEAYVKEKSRLDNLKLSLVINDRAESIQVMAIVHGKSSSQKDGVPRKAKKKASEMKSLAKKKCREFE